MGFMEIWGIGVLVCGVSFIIIKWIQKERRWWKELKQAHQNMDEVRRRIEDPDLDWDAPDISRSIGEVRTELRRDVTAMVNEVRAMRGRPLLEDSTGILLRPTGPPPPQVPSPSSSESSKSESSTTEKKAKKEIKEAFPLLGRKLRMKDNGLNSKDS